MSSMTKHLYSVSFAAIAAIAIASPAFAQNVVFTPGTGDGSRVTVPESQVDPSGGNIPAAIQRWKMLSQGGNYSFGEYASFLMTYPGWPGETAMRRNAEQVLNPRSWAPHQVVAFFDRMPPVTNAGRAKYAIALESTGNRAQAIKWGKKAWHAGPLTDSDESALRSVMGSALTADDHDRRIDALLWKGATRSATAMLPYASARMRPVYSARLAVMTRASDADSQISNTGSAGMRNAGMLASRATQLRRQGSAWTARQLLANRPPLDAPPADPEEWYEVLLKLGREAANDRQWKLAYDIASKVDDGLPPGTDVSKQGLGVRDDYTSLTWLAGTVALERLNRPRDAMVMFEKYGNAARTPQTRTKGWYWAARSAQRAGDRATATSLYERAARYYDKFYGQLSLEALGRSMPARAPAIRLTRPSEEAAVFTAARIIRNRSDQTQFLRAIANHAESQDDFAAAFDLSKRIGRPDLSVMAGRNARVEGHSEFIPHAYPAIPLPSGHQNNFTMIHAITRQESQFDRAAVSHAGARGLMQLMPATARETSRKINMAYRRSALTTDTAYNIRLGSTYIRRMLDYYGGSYPLAVAAYNAGPGNVNRWLRANGDPRTGAIDILTWIERIPIFETKNYVQRVLENAVMYDHLNPDRALIRSSNPLSRYLGKNRPG